ncbi:copper-binding protein [Castellaniella sp.]|uniref:copper-binding protein n=1 Tax=Castellaniella sp. TaxID=1955812 RepID=UPI0035604030
MNPSTLSAGAVALLAATGLAAQVVVAQPVQAQASGKVVRVDVAKGKIAIQHGAIAALELPAMTLVYQIDPALLAGVSAGDTVKFTAERNDKQYRIVQLGK